jgi:16S rRNA (guanine527-N7)-methyltransferase
MFLALLVAVAYTAVAVTTGRRIKIHVSPRLAQAFYLGLLLILALNWMSKLFILGYGPSPYPGGWPARNRSPAAAAPPDDREALEAALRQYLDLLLERNRTTNLTALRDPAAAWDRLILASLRLLEAHPFSGDERVADVGTGGGLPGIPLRLALPGIRLTLVESDQRKAGFLRDAVAALDLADVDIEAKRAEELGQDPQHRERYDVVVTRAVAKAPVAAEYCLPLVRPGGVLLAQARLADWRAAATALGQLGGRLSGEKAGAVVVNKTRPTPMGFPRRTGTPAKRPLWPQAAQLAAA